MSQSIALRPFSVSEYARMRKAGILTENDRVELIDGEIRVMAPIGPLHSGIVNRLNRVLQRRLGDSAVVSVQNPIQLGDFSEPEPDLAVLRPREDDYADSHPTAADVLLVIEVSDETLDYDREEKIPRYAAAGIPEVWLVDVAGQSVEQYADPRQDHHETVQTLGRGDILRSSSVAGLEVPLSAILR
jgi:Uma2 family endonuclease